jgi:flagellar assembly protein FliH
MLEVTAQIARAVIRAELAIQPQSVAHVIEEALAALPLGARNVRVYVSAADRALLEDFGAGEAVPALLVDATLAPGDCRVEAAESLVDFRQSARLGCDPRTVSSAAPARLPGAHERECARAVRACRRAADPP